MQGAVRDNSPGWLPSFDFSRDVPFSVRRSESWGCIPSAEQPACPGLPGTPDLHQTLPDFNFASHVRIVCVYPCFCYTWRAASGRHIRRWMAQVGQRARIAVAELATIFYYQIGGPVNDGNLNLSIEMRRSQTWTCRHGTPIHPTFPPGAATLQARRLRDTILCRSCAQNDQSRWLVIIHA